MPFHHIASNSTKKALLLRYYTLFRLAKYNVTKANTPNFFVESRTNPDQPLMHVILRNKNHAHLSRIQSARPSEGEIFYLRTLLQHRAARSYKDLKTINDREYPTFQETASHLGLFAEENEAEYALHEATMALRTPRQIRILFIHLLVNDCIPVPLTTWDTYRPTLAFDFYVQNGHDITIAVNKTLQELAFLLEEYGKQLADYGLPEPVSYTAEVEHELQRWNADIPRLRASAQTALSTMNSGQSQTFQTIITAILQQRGLLAFIDGRAGRGKTFVLNAICAAVRGSGGIVLPTATSAFAAQLYPGGRTTHSTFKVHKTIYYLPHSLKHKLPGPCQ